jgi:cell wall-associated NlpC family hydrolase
VAAPKPPAAPFVAIPYPALAFSPQAWLNDNPASPTGASALAIGAHYLGVPYVWGGSVPATGFDCSGLTRFVYQQLGVELPHYAAAQFAMFTKLDPAELAPGDLVFFEPQFDGPGHVAIYAGGDQIIEAPHTGALVRYASLSGAAAALGFLGAVRPYDASTVVEEPFLPRIAWPSTTVGVE